MKYIKNKTNQEFYLLMEFAPVGLFITNPQGECTYVNPWWSEITGLSFQNAKGQGWSQALAPIDRERVFAEWNQSVKESRIFSLEYRFLRPNGELRWVIGKSIAIKSEDGEIIEYLGSVQDITEIVKTRQELAQKNKMASLGEMASGLAHEINNPLTIIQGKAHQITKTSISTEGYEFFLKESCNKIDNSCKRISSIIRSLRLFSQEKIEENIQNISVEVLLQETILIFETLTKKNEILFERHIQNPQKIIECNKIQIEEVLYELLKNAIDAHEQTNLQNQKMAKTIRLICEELNQGLQITVMDNGAGILKEIKDKIMEPFFSTKELRSGQGLGLSISKGIIESHGGELTCMETPQGGTSFSLWIPYQQLKVLNK